MSYLANLAAKTLGVANLARPRLPALFDPQPQSLAASALFASNALAAPGAAEFAADDIVEIVEVERAPAPFSVPRHAARTARVAVRPQPEAVAAPAERESAEAVSARRQFSYAGRIAVLVGASSYRVVGAYSRRFTLRSRCYYANTASLPSIHCLQLNW